MAVLMRGPEVAAGMRAELLSECEGLKKLGINPALAIVRVGERADDLSYERGALKRAASLGIEARVFELPEDINQHDFEAAFSEINSDPAIHGILLFSPLPAQLNDDYVRRVMSPLKDVDGMSYVNIAKVFAGEPDGFAPCTPGAVMEMLRYYGVGLEGKNVVIVGRGMVSGRPLAMLALAAHATVTICHTKTVDMPSICRRADILIVAAGRAGMIGPEYVTEKSVVIDVGINVNSEGKLCGDVDFDAVSSIASMISPVPGGVGAVTTSILCRNVLRAARLQLQAKSQTGNAG